MQKITGRLISKSLVKEGESNFGKWRIIQFLIKKTFNKTKYEILFVAKGKWADFIDSVQVKEKITVHYIPVCTEYRPSKWATDLKAIEIEKYVSKKTLPIYVGNDMVNKSEFEHEKDLQLPLKQKEGGKE